MLQMLCIYVIDYIYATNYICDIYDIYISYIYQSNAIADALNTEIVFKWI